MAEPALKQTLSGWGRYPVHESLVYRPEKRRSVADILEEGAQPHYIARGLGRSYGDAAINGGGGTIACERLDRMLDFDAKSGVLHCEAGVTLEDIILTLLPRGFFLPVTPGTKHVTVGGAIAHDVHGKNHHRDGTFGAWVEDLELLLPSGKIMTCSPEENSDVFWATVGGAGLTGVILTARIRMLAVESAYFVVDYLKAKNIDEVLAAIEETGDRYQYSVAWVDCLAKGKSLGRSVLMNGNHAKHGDLPAHQSDPLYVAPKRQFSIPVDFPGFVLNPLSIKTFNTAYYGKASTVEGKITDYNSYFYPLDVLHHWNRMYGKPGFVQYQFTVPTDETQGLIDMLGMMSRSGRASFLAVLKKLGPANAGLLSYPFEGYTLTLDIAVRKGLVPFLHELDAKLLDHGGRLYLAKDAAMTADTFKAMYPRLPEFQAIRKRLDPGNLLSSSLSRRIGLTGEET